MVEKEIVEAFSEMTEEVQNETIQQWTIRTYNWLNKARVYVKSSESLMSKMAGTAANNLLEKSNATVNDMTVALFGTGLEEVAYAYVKAEKEWGVNAIFLASLTAEESGWGRSNRAINQNNLSGYAVYSAGASGRSFSSKEESIMETAKLICQQYLKPTGAYYNGISIYDVNIKYCPNDGGTWSKNISSIAYSLVSKINNR